MRKGQAVLPSLPPVVLPLRASPPEFHGILVTPFHLLLGNAPTSALLNIPPGVSPFQLEPALQTPPASATKAPEPLPEPKW